jgi:hypothetical protein
MAAHLNLKAVKLGANREAVAQTLGNFLDAYQRNGGNLPSNLSAHAGVIAAVRVVGISQVNYLDDAQKIEAIARAEALLNGAPVTIP